LSIPTFLVENCSGCPHHEPNGDSSWGDQVLALHQKQLRENEDAKRERIGQLTRLREQLQRLPHDAIATSEVTERQILVFSEELFSHDESRQTHAADLLSQSARIAPELFPPLVIDILLEQAVSDDFAALCLPICVELAGRRLDLGSRLKDTALAVIEKGIRSELASQILLRLGGEMEYPVTAEVIRKLVLHQQHVLPVGGWSGDPPEYP